MRLATEIARAIESVLENLLRPGAIPGSAIGGQLPGAVLPPPAADADVPYAAPLTVKEIDGSPSVADVVTIRFSNGTVTDDGGGQVTVTISAAVTDGDKGDVVVSSSGTVWTLDTSGVSAGTYGSATQVPQVTFDAKGRATAASNVTISGVAPGGTAGGDLNGTYPNPTVDGLQGYAVASTAPATADRLRYSGTQWEPSAKIWQPLTNGDATTPEIVFASGDVIMVEV